MRVLTKFLVGVGMDASDFDKGERDITTKLGGIKSTVLQTSAAIASALVGAFGAAAASAANTAKRVDEIALSAVKYQTGAKFINDYGNSLRLLGGQASDALQAVGAAEDALMQLKLKGSFAAFEDPALAGVDTLALAQAKTGQDFLRTLSTMLPGLNKDQQRLIQQNFGFSDATMASLRNGAAFFDQGIARAAELAGGFDQLIDKSREYNKQLTELSLRWEGLGNTLADKMLPGMTGVVKGLSDFIDYANKQFKEDPTKATATGLGGAGVIAAGAGTGATALGSAIGGASGKALSTTGAALRGAGIVGIAVGAGLEGGKVVDEWNAPIREAIERRKEKIAEGVQKIEPRMDMSPPAMTKLDEARSEQSTRLSDRITSAIGNTQETRTPIQNNIDLTVELSGQALEAKIIDVNSRRDMNTLEDVMSTTAR